MFECMSVCMYEYRFLSDCIYVCMYVCMYGRNVRYVRIWMSDRKWVSAIVLWSVYSARSSRSARMYVCMYGGVYVCKYVSMAGGRVVCTILL